MNPTMLLILFGVATAVGFLSRSTSLAEGLVRHANVVTTIVVSAVTAIVINNLPAASLFAAHSSAHPYALLLGLDLGPNCVITGALSSLLWLRIARNNGIRPSLRTFSLMGTIIAITAISCTAVFV
jgi:arsenical pump membrane protein